MKNYLVFRDQNVTDYPVIGVRCTVQDAGTFYPLRHIAIHSPTGFETGYGGSGPTDLALSILADHFGESAAQCRAGSSNAWALHQDFKWAFMAKRPLRPGEGYTITQEDIRVFLEGVNREVKDLSVPPEPTPWSPPVEETAALAGVVLDGGDVDPEPEGREVSEDPLAPGGGDFGGAGASGDIAEPTSTEG